MAIFSLDLCVEFANFAVKSFSGAGLRRAHVYVLITVAGSVIAGEILIRCQLRRFQEVVISRRIQREIFHSLGVHQHVIEIPEVEGR
jgi:hypothetical protein